jgi:hypothetical protein
MGPAHHLSVYHIADRALGLDGEVGTTATHRHSTPLGYYNYKWGHPWLWHGSIQHPTSNIHPLIRSIPSNRDWLRLNKQTPSATAIKTNAYTLTWLIFLFSIFINVNSIYLQKWYMSLYTINISTNYIFNKIFAVLIWMDGPTNHERVWKVVKSLK